MLQGSVLDRVAQTGAARTFVRGRTHGTSEVSGEQGDRDYQLCSFLRAHNFWIMSDSRAHLETMMKELDVDSRRFGAGTKALIVVVDDEHVC